MTKTLSVHDFARSQIRQILQKVASAAEGHSYWNAQFVAESILSCQGPNLHLAILVEPYLELILNGRKTVESRFSVHRIPPFGCVEKDDVLLLKKSGGPIAGICQVTQVWSYHLNPQSWSEIRTRFVDQLCIKNPMFWAAKKRAVYATLMRIANVMPTPAIAYDKRDRRGWIVVASREQQGRLRNQQTR